MVRAHETLKTGTVMVQHPTSHTMLTRYEDELKFLVSDEDQLLEVYGYVKDRLANVNEACIRLSDTYLDDQLLTLHDAGISLRARCSETSSENKCSLDLKMKRHNPHAGITGAYIRRETKKSIGSNQWQALRDGTPLAEVEPESHDLIADLTAVPFTSLTAKFDVVTERRELMTQADDASITFNFDAMQYRFAGQPHRYFELEIKITSNATSHPEIVDCVVSQFNLKQWGKSKYDRGIYLFRKAFDGKRCIQMDELVNLFHLTPEQAGILDDHLPALQNVYQDFIFHLPYFTREERLILDELQCLKKDDIHDDTVATAPRKFVHSFRSRLKNPAHLIVKIVRKADKYFQGVVDVVGNEQHALTIENYKSILTDLIGVRVLHLFKDNWLEIDEQLTSLYHDKIVEKKFYVRKGDEIQGMDDLQEAVERRGFEFLEKESGYRSAHYLIKRDIYVDSGDMFTTYVEIQVRTVFEEAWGEVDHEIRYPHYDKDININHFLKTFNRIVGSADEMATYIKAYRDSIKSGEAE